MRNILQLGLYQTAEWAYLTLPGWEDMVKGQKPENRLPDFYMDDPESFRYFGVDVSPRSINHVALKYKLFPNTFFIACGVGKDFAIENTPNPYYDYDPMVARWYEYLNEKDDTLFTFVPFPFLLENLGIDELTVLAVDIDRFEPQIFSSINDWKIFPEFVTVEVSPRFDYGLMSLMDKAGYTHIKTFPQYLDVEINASSWDIAHIHEQQFLRNDIYEANKETIVIEHVYNEVSL